MGYYVRGLEFENSKCDSWAYSLRDASESRLRNKFAQKGVSTTESTPHIRTRNL